MLNANIPKYHTNYCRDDPCIKKRKDERGSISEKVKSVIVNGTRMSTPNKPAYNVAINGEVVCIAHYYIQNKVPIRKRLPPSINLLYSIGSAITAANLLLKGQERHQLKRVPSPEAVSHLFFFQEGEGKRAMDMVFIVEIRPAFVDVVRSNAKN